MALKHIKPNDMSRREVLKGVLYGGAVAALGPMLWVSGCGRKRAQAEQRNVILVSIDTLRADHLGCYGYHRPTSPVLDEFAREGLLFEDVTASSPWTLPSHGTMLTGLYPNRHGLHSYNNVLPVGMRTIADIFKEKGIQTAAVVNSHCLTPRYGLHQGFEDYEYIKEILNLRKPSEVGSKAQQWLSSRGQKPFFLFLHYYDLHSDYASLPKYERQFVRPYQGRANGTTRQLIMHRLGNVKFDQKAANHLIDLYDASIRQIDDEIGKLLLHLRTEKLLDETMVIITSDHGEEFLEHGGVMHSQTQYQEMLKVPLMMRGPGLGQQKRINEIVSLVDLMPTILSVMGIEVPEGLDGTDLSGLWRQTNYKLPSRYVYAGASRMTGPLVKSRPELHDIQRAVRHPQYKMHYNKLTKETQLFDLQNDPGEKADVAGKHVALVESMMGQLERYMKVNQAGAKLPPLQAEEINKLKSLGYL